MSPNGEASSVIGWMSIACWIIVYSPQIYENYTLQSGEGLSVLFVVTWLLGDITNLVGASMAGLLPTVILLAIYYTICDIVLLVQIYYYRWRSARLQGGTTHGETSPLLTPAPATTEDDYATPVEKQSRLRGRAALYTYAALFVALTGVTAFFVNRARREEVQNPTDPTGGGPEEDVFEWRSQVLGWTSASLYLGSRIPQIIKNAKTRCAGLSLGMFVFALGGNLTYVLSIVVASTSRKHLVANASWLAGSGLTMFLDFVVLYQFFHYRTRAAAEHT